MNVNTNANEMSCGFSLSSVCDTSFLPDSSRLLKVFIYE